MYRIKPLSVVPDDVDLPKCMYHIKPINGMSLDSLRGSVPQTKRVRMDPELQVIEDRQLEVINRLRQLRDNVDDLIKKAGGVNLAGQINKRSTVAANNKNASAHLGLVSSTALSNAELPSEMVIEANPSRPPLSLIFFQKIDPSLRMLTHTHSTCDQNVNQSLKDQFLRDATKFSATMRVVWKKLTHTRLTPPHLGSGGVEGESNVARYLSRILAPSDSILNYDAIPIEDLVLVDNVLNSSDLAESSPDQFLSALQAYVQRTNSGTRTIADFVGYSTLRYLTQQRPKISLQKSVVDWMNCLTNEVHC